jgi:hypothetical protein
MGGSPSYQTADRWQVGYNSAWTGTPISKVQVSTVPPGSFSTQALLLQGTPNAKDANTNLQASQKIESIFSRQLAEKTVTLSTWYYAASGAGTDATIYDPAPDFRFINDTGNYILIQSRIEGNNIYFDFWGTKDGRLVEKTKPTVTKIVKPGPTKIIETLDLKPGEKKCTEKAHNGADASFYYKVTYPNGDIKDKTFNSHYVPWREVCLLGVEKLSTDIAPATATTTETTAQTTEIKNPL